MALILTTGLLYFVVAAVWFANSVMEDAAQTSLKSAAISFVTAAAWPLFLASVAIYVLILRRAAPAARAS